jgi:hypothetical protein
MMVLKRSINHNFIFSPLNVISATHISFDFLFMKNNLFFNLKIINDVMPCHNFFVKQLLLMFNFTSINMFFFSWY